MKRKKSITFAEWIEQIGHEAIAKKLKINPETVRYWQSGRCYPKVTHMREIKKMANGAIGYDQIIDGGK